LTKIEWTDYDKLTKKCQQTNAHRNKDQLENLWMKSCERGRVKDTERKCVRERELKREWERQNVLASKRVREREWERESIKGRTREWVWMNKWMCEK